MFQVTCTNPVPPQSVPAKMEIEELECTGQGFTQR